MRFTWSEHLSAARTLGHAGQENSGTALALMGVALLLLLQDLNDNGQAGSARSDSNQSR
ncbi:hypothetical protein [Vulcanococcus limneticus]|uniref:hypothetical protein n=1 Tax=Vulcanococcus limneticus TaxID=2170428 RepID=UPI0018E33CFB|nr:hypothetical protein [Vulcanococcus limneticus]MCP9792295.1 hypothetical protein [Vulcanococcus limneticus MW73D5]MCP9893860.1 hypothetical protein [Vulcanococcus limneticus Candia 3F8]MCP9897644.1 hypothetical protein [Vulcanococcus limneticus Candia 3B3]